MPMPIVGVTAPSAGDKVTLNQSDNEPEPSVDTSIQLFDEARVKLAIKEPGAGPLDKAAIVLRGSEAVPGLERVAT